MADSISLLYGVMFEYDESGLESYWAEALRSAAVQDPGVSSADLSALLETRGEPIERSFGHYAHHLTCCIRRPIDLAHRLFYELVPGLTEAHLTLAPVDAQLARNSAIADVLKPYLGSASVPPIGLRRGPTARYGGEPPKHARTRSVIKRYEDWLYPRWAEQVLSPWARHGLGALAGLLLRRDDGMTWATDRWVGPCLVPAAARRASPACARVPSWGGAPTGSALTGG